MKTQFFQQKQVKNSKNTYFSFIKSTILISLNILFPFSFRQMSSNKKSQMWLIHWIKLTSALMNSTHQSRQFIPYVKITFKSSWSKKKEIKYVLFAMQLKNQRNFDAEQKIVDKSIILNVSLERFIISF